MVSNILSAEISRTEKHLSLYIIWFVSFCLSFLSYFTWHNNSLLLGKLKLVLVHAAGAYPPSNSCHWGWGHCLTPEACPKEKCRSSLRMFSTVLLVKHFKSRYWVTFSNDVGAVKNPYVLCYIFVISLSFYYWGLFIKRMHLNLFLMYF